MQVEGSKVRMSNAYTNKCHGFHVNFSLRTYLVSRVFLVDAYAADAEPLQKRLRF